MNRKNKQSNSGVFSHLKTSVEELEKSLNDFHSVCNNLQNNKSEKNSLIKENVRIKFSKVLLSL